MPIEFGSVRATLGLCSAEAHDQQAVIGQRLSLTHIALRSMVVASNLPLRNGIDATLVHNLHVVEPAAPFLYGFG